MKQKQKQETMYSRKKIKGDKQHETTSTKWKDLIHGG